MQILDGLGSAAEVTDASQLNNVTEVSQSNSVTDVFETNNASDVFETNDATDVCQLDNATDVSQTKTALVRLSHTTEPTFPTQLLLHTAVRALAPRQINTRVSVVVAIDRTRKKCQSLLFGANYVNLSGKLAEEERVHPSFQSQFVYSQPIRPLRYKQVFAAIPPFWREIC